MCEFPILVIGEIVFVWTCEWFKSYGNRLQVFASLAPSLGEVFEFFIKYLCKISAEPLLRSLGIGLSWILIIIITVEITSGSEVIK